MTRRAIILALALLSFGPGAGAGIVISGTVHYANPAPCTADECRLFLASQCTADIFVEKSGTFASIVPIPAAARGQNGFLEWKRTGNASQDTARYAFISDTCTLIFGGFGSSVTIPVNAAWFVFSRGMAFQATGSLLNQPIWWRWRQT